MPEGSNRIKIYCIFCLVLSFTAQSSVTSDGDSSLKSKTFNKLINENNECEVSLFCIVCSRYLTVINVSISLWEGAFGRMLFGG